MCGNSAPTVPASRSRTSAWVCLVMCMGALFALAGAFYLGDIGKTRDDYTWAVNDPVTGVVAIFDLWRLPLFWRPLSLVIVRHLVSLTWEVPWIANILTSIAYLGLSVAVWRWFRSFGFVLAAGAGAMLLLCLPMAFDVMHWPAAMPTALGGIIVVFIAHRVIKLQADDRSLGASGFIAVLVFVACCLNEQAVACIGGVALVPLFVQGSWARRIRSTVAWGAVLVIPGLLYVLLVSFTAPSTHRGGVSTFVAAGAWPGRTIVILAQAWSQLVGPHGRDLMLGGLKTGLPTLGVAGTVLVVIALAAGLVWAWKTPRALDRQIGPRSPVLFVLGLSWAGLGLSPFILVQTGPVEARHVVLPVIGLLLAFFALLDWCFRRVPDRASDTLARVATSLAVVLACVGAVSLVGIQTTLRERYRMDMQEAQAIAALYPAPEPGAVILIARSSWREASTGYKHYDMRFWSAWQMDHIATAVLRHQYRRDDIFAKHRFSMAFGVDDNHVDDQGWTTGLSSGPAWDGGRLSPRLIPWQRVLGVRIRDDGAAVPINALVFVQQGKGSTRVELTAVVPSEHAHAPESFQVRLR